MIVSPPQANLPAPSTSRAAGSASHPRALAHLSTFEHVVLLPHVVHMNVQQLLVFSGIAAASNMHAHGYGLKIFF